LIDKCCKNDDVVKAGVTRDLTYKFTCFTLKKKEFAPSETFGKHMGRIISQYAYQTIRERKIKDAGSS